MSAPGAVASRARMLAKLRFPKAEEKPRPAHVVCQHLLTDLAVQPRKYLPKVGGEGAKPGTGAARMPVSLGARPQLRRVNSTPPMRISAPLAT